MGSMHFLCFLLLSLIPTSAYCMKLEAFEFNSFNSSVAQSFSLVSPAEISGNLLKLTPSNWVSRAILKKKFKLWNLKPPVTARTLAGESNRAISFNTSFSVVLTGSGGGIAFLIGPDTLLPQFVGLTNTTLDGHILAVVVQIQMERSTEYEGQVTVHQNGTQMKARPFKIPKTPYFNVWVDYSGVSRDLEVRVSASSMSRQESPRPARPSVKVLLFISQIVSQDSYFGFSASTGNVTAQTYSISRWSLAVNEFSDEFPVEVKSDYVVLAVQIAAVTITAFFIFLVANYWNFDMMNCVTSRNRSE